MTTRQVNPIHPMITKKPNRECSRFITLSAKLDKAIYEVLLKDLQNRAAVERFIIRFCNYISTHDELRAKIISTYKSNIESKGEFHD